MSLLPALLALLARPAVANDGALNPTLLEDDPFAVADSEFQLSMRLARQEFDVLMPRWAQSYDAISLLAGKVEAHAAHLMKLEATLLDESARRSSGVARVHELEASVNRMEQQLALATGDEQVRRAALEVEQRTLDEAMANADNAARAMTATLTRLGRAGRPAQSDLERWWSTRRGLRWDQVMASGLTSREAAAHDAARLAFEDEASQLGGEVPQRLHELAFLADEEDEARNRMWKLQVDLRVDAAGLATLKQDLEDHRVQLDDARAWLAAQEQRVAAARTDLENARAAAPPADPRNDEWRQLQNELGALDQRLSRLSGQVQAYGGTLNDDDWCGLFVRAGLVRVMSARPGAYAEGVGLLRQAAAAYTTPCRAVMASYVHVGVFQAAWAESMLIAAASTPATVELQLTGGRWEIDGSPLQGAGGTALRLLPGVHRFEYSEAGQMVWLVEQINPGERVMLAASPHGVAPVRTTSTGPTPDQDVAPIRMPYDPWLVPEPEPEPEPDPRRARFVAGGRLMRSVVPAYDVTADLAGLSAEISWRAREGRAVGLDVGFAQDVAFGGDPRHYTENFQFAGLLRERGVLGVRRAEGRVRPGGTLSLGLIPPALALVVEGGAELEVHLTDEIAATFGLNIGASFWQLSPGTIDPSLSFGVVRWF